MNLKNAKELAHSRFFYVTIFSILFTLFFIFLCFRYSILSSFSPHYYNSRENVDTVYAQGARYVNANASTLYYTGYDYFDNTTVKGHYYYSLEEKRCTIYLIGNDYIGNESSPPPVLNDVSFRAFLVKNDHNLKPLLEYMASDLEWNYNGILRYSSMVVISPYNYNYVLNLIILIITIVSCILTFGLIVYNAKKISSFK
jgi:hypothetical protein